MDFLQVLDMSWCMTSEIGTLQDIISTVITIIQVAVPILLIIFGMITYVRAITDSDNDNITKANKTIVNMFIAAVAIFLVPTIVGFVFDVAGANSNGVIDCFYNADKEGIINGYMARIETSFSKVD